MSRLREHLRARVLVSLDLLGDTDPREHRYRHVEDDQVRVQLLHALHGPATIFSLAYDIHVRLGSDDSARRLQVARLAAEKDSFLEEHVARAVLKLCDDGRLVIVEGARHWLHIK